MKKVLLLISVFSFLFVNANTKATILRGQKAAEKVPNSEIVRLKDFTSIPNYVKFRKGKELPLVKLESWLNQFYITDANFGLRLIKKEVGKMGLTHYHYQQTVNGNPVKYGIYIAHVKNGMVESINGELFDNVSIANASLPESSALIKALDYINAVTYKWEIPKQEEHLKWEQNDPTATYYPKGELILINKDGNIKEELILTYRFNIYSEKPFGRKEVYVNAQNGTIVWEENKIHEADVAGTATTLYSGTQTIISDNSSGPFRLQETGRGNGIRTFTNGNTTTYSNTDITNGSATWTTPDAGIDAHWGAEMTYDYFLNEHGRNSIDGNGFQLNSYVHHDQNYSNAFWDGQRMTYGDGGGNNTPFTALDIAGHEITHGVISNSANLVYQAESGALNESFCDIFGISVDFINRPGVADWLLGDDLGFIIRDMENPNSQGDPNTYFGNNWASLTGGDNGGVHTNSAIQNLWFVLLTDGGTGTNDNLDNYTVNQLGLTTAGQIAYRNLTVYLTSSSDYNDARFYAIQSTVDLFGGCTNEVEQVTNAWYAVGVGPAYVATVVSDFSTPSLSSCSVPFTVNFNNLSTNGNTYSWDFGDGNNSTQNNPSNTYTTTGTFTVELIADGGLCGLDTNVKTTYINITTPANAVTTGDAICPNNQATLTASGSNTLDWYAAAIGGPIINSGGTYLTPPLAVTTTYYVTNSVYYPTLSGAKPDNTGGGGNFNNQRFIYFDAYVPMEIIDVVVYANGAGNRTIELRDNTGTVLASTTVNIANGQQSVPLGFQVPVGTDFELALASGTANIDLYRNNANVNYPYSLAGLGDITRSDAGTNGGLNHYYFFYDWNVKEPDCVSPRTMVTATINALPTVVANATAIAICDGNQITLTGSGATNYVWDNGVTDGVAFNPNTTLTYTVTGTDGNNCSNQDQITVTVNICTGVDGVNGVSQVTSFINAANNLELGLTNLTQGNYNLVVLNALGQVVVTEQIKVNATQQSETVNMQSVAKGLYYVKLYNTKSSYTTKLVK